MTFCRASLHAFLPALLRAIPLELPLTLLTLFNFGASIKVKDVCLGKDAPTLPIFSLNAGRLAGHSCVNVWFLSYQRGSAAYTLRDLFLRGLLRWWRLGFLPLLVRLFDILRKLPGIVFTASLFTRRLPRQSNGPRILRWRPTPIISFLTRLREPRSRTYVVSPLV